MKVDEAYVLQKKLIRFFDENQSQSLTANDCFIIGRTVEIMSKSIRNQELGELKVRKPSMTKSSKSYVRDKD